MVPVEYAVYRKAGPGWRILERTIPNHEPVFISVGKGRITLSGREQAVEEEDRIYCRPDLGHGEDLCCFRHEKVLPYQKIPESGGDASGCIFDSDALGTHQGAFDK